MSWDVIQSISCPKPGWTLPNRSWQMTSNVLLNLQCWRAHCLPKWCMPLFDGSHNWKGFSCCLTQVFLAILWDHYCLSYSTGPKEQFTKLFNIFEACYRASIALLSSRLNIMPHRLWFLGLCLFLLLSLGQFKWSLHLCCPKLDMLLQLEPCQHWVQGFLHMP